MKTMETIKNIIANLSDSEFEVLNTLDGEYWYEGMKPNVRRKLTRELKKHGLTFTEWGMWIAD